MKTPFLVLTLALFLGLGAQAQKFAYIDSDYVLQHMPEYAEAQARLNELSAQWQEEIEAKYESIARLEAAYRAEKVLLTEEMKKRREAEIADKRREAAELQKKKFGVEGELFQKREELIQPVQDKMFDAIKEVARNGSYMVVFDIKNNSNMLYSNPKYNVSDKVIKEMGYTPGETIEAKGDKDGASGKEKASGAAASGTKTGSAGGTQQTRTPSKPGGK
ncbi:MAG: OmpH family outer membrane protein [Flavobacteriales bacterium]|jgi:outer membrane protein|nr:OmpH family outer membrane protein [Flavobacteriales bacterium]MDP4953832.1 OmpH family outer membrane protein [Flavobacteriales bacterium]